MDIAPFGFVVVVVAAVVVVVVGVVVAVLVAFACVLVLVLVLVLGLGIVLAESHKGDHVHLGQATGLADMQMPMSSLIAAVATPEYDGHMYQRR